MINVYEGRNVVDSRLLELSTRFRNQESGMPIMWMPKWAALKYDWFQYALDFNHMAEHRMYSGSSIYLTDNALAKFNIPPYPVHPILVECEDTIFFFHRIKSKDRGSILVWPYDLFFDPTAVCELCVHPLIDRVLQHLGYEVTKSGREDCVVNLTPELFHNCRERVRRSWNISKDSLNTSVMGLEEAHGFLFGEDVLKASLETMTQNLKSDIPTADFSAHHQITTLDVETCIFHEKWAHKVCLFGSFFQDTLVAYTTVWMDNSTQTGHWIGSVWRREEQSDILWGKANRVTNTLIGIMKLLPSLGVKKFNLGINNYPYKHDFRPEIVHFPGFTAGL